MKRLISSILSVILTVSAVGALVHPLNEVNASCLTEAVSDNAIDGTSIDLFNAVNEQGINDFVTRMYQVCLGRKPDANGLKDWTGQLTGGKATGISVSFGFIFSKELQEKNVSNDEYIEIMYQAFFGRKSDPTGKQYWLDKMNGGMSRSDLFAGFANSKEFYDLCRSYGIIAGTYVPGQDRNRVAQVNLFVERLYNVVLGRTCDQTGMENWTNNLLKGSITGIQAAYGFFFSPEYEGKRKTYTQYVTDLYNALMGRGPDDTGRSYWLGRMYSGATKEMVFNGFALSQEFKGICSGYGIVQGSAIPESNNTTHTLINDDPSGGGPSDPVELKTPDQIAKEYKYEIMPILSPLNTYFYVKTDDPFVFDMSFVDYNSTLSDGSPADVISLCSAHFKDVKYEDYDAYRVHGGYIFVSSSYKNDGGELVVRINGKDTSVRVNCQKTYDQTTYLIEKYGSKDKGFFDNMDAIQDGLQGIAFYPREFVDTSRRSSEYPSYAASPYAETGINEHIVEIFYRLDSSDYSEYLIGQIYPYILDSKGFPNQMIQVARKLDSNVRVSGTGDHYLYAFKLNGTTKNYGGYGLGKMYNSFIDIKDIGKLFTFDGSSSDLAMSSFKAVSDKYEELTPDDRSTISSYRQMLKDGVSSLPSSGVWTRIGVEGTNIFAFAYMPSPGYFADNVWVDGRYISDLNIFESGEHFSDHPQADIIVRNKTYKNKNGDKITGDVYYFYVPERNRWEAYGAWGTKENIPSDLILTQDQVKKMNVDSNTDMKIGKCYSFDGTLKPGTLINNTADIPTDDCNTKVVAADKAHFPNDYFRDYIASKDTDKDGYLSKKEISDIRIIQLYDQDLGSLKGIEYLTSLETLYLYKCKLSSLDLSKNKELLSLCVPGCGLTGLDLSKNTKLEYLECSKNKLSSLVLSSNTGLRHLKCSGNSITSLDLSKNTLLEYLDCSANGLTSLNVSACTKMVILDAYANKLTSLDTSKMKQLKMLRTYGNSISSLSISQSPFLSDVKRTGTYTTYGQFIEYAKTGVSYYLFYPASYTVIEVNCPNIPLTIDPNRVYMQNRINGGYVIRVDSMTALK
ncbi:MAG: DUF4214 domain-containing protein [Clostridiales bacterium]|nr:DUF4214 domain-containing protein [Clostridiales bacterium]